MFLATNLIGFGAKRGGVPTTPALVDRTAGTNLGDMTFGGGLAAGFDGNTAQGWYVGPAANNVTSADIGKRYSTGKYINKAVIHPNTTYGLSADSVTITITLRAKNGARSSATDGTSLGSASVSNSQPTAVTINSSNQASAYTDVWVTFAASGTANINISELEIWELV